MKMRTLTIVIGTVVVVTIAAAFFVSPRMRETAADLYRQTGLVDAPTRAPKAIDLIVDISEGLTDQDIEHYAQTLDVILPWMSNIPGSTLRVIVQGETALNATIIEPIARMPLVAKNRKARIAQQERFLVTAKALLVQAMKSVLKQQQPLHSSPIADTISWTAMLSLPSGLPPDTERILILISNALEVSSDYGDFECGRLPTPEEFIKALQGRGAFAPGSLQHIPIHFTFTTLRPITRSKCHPTTLARLKQIQDLWIAAAKSAGATVVIFHTHVVALDVGESEEQI